MIRPLSAGRGPAIPRPLLGLLVLCLLFSPACRQKSEAERLAQYRASLSYRAYQKVSEGAVGPLAGSLGERLGHPVDPRVIHGLLALLWVLRDEPGRALVEADLFTATAPGVPQNLALAVRTTALQKLEFPEASAAQFAALKACLAAEGIGGPGRTDPVDRLALAALLLLSLQQKDDDTALQSAQALAAIRGLDYLPTLVRMTLAVRDGRLVEAEAHLKSLEASPAFERHRQDLRAQWSELQARAMDRKEGSERFLQVLMEGLLKDLHAGAQEWPLYEEVTALVDRLSKSLETGSGQSASPPAEAGRD